jgi:hypothetical protein
MCSLIAPIFFSLALLSHSETHAPLQAGVPIIHGRGEKIVPLGELPPQALVELRRELQHDVSLGYAYKYWHVYWCPVWTWDGKYVLYHNDKSWVLKEEHLRNVTGKSEEELGKPFWYRCPQGQIVLAVLGALAVFGTIVSRRDQRRAALFADPDYQAALAILAGPRAPAPSNEPPPSPERLQEEFDKRFRDAVDFLVAKGLPVEQAEANLRVMVRDVSAGRVPETSAATDEVTQPPLEGA